ncbi:MAG: PAS domain-containing protein [Microscillaceae bacterium]|nr:PAS domain-containing protein [Microscillaceae bacterium]
MDAYRLVNQFSSELHGQLHADFQIEWLNNQFWACLKYAPGTVLQKNLLELCAQSEDQHILRLTSQQLQAGQVSTSFKITLKTQLNELLRLKMKIVRASEAHYFIIAQPLVSDVEPTTRFRRFFDLSLLDMVVILNQSREIIYANHGMDYEQNQIPKITFEHCFSPEDKPRILQLLLELVRQEGQAHRFTGQIIKKGGQRAWIDWSILFAKGNYYGVGNDVSENEKRGQQIQHLLHETVALNRQLEEQNQMLLDSQEKLRETLTSLEQRNTELDQFVYRVSHDIRAPLASVMGLINLIRTTNIPVEEFSRYHELMDYSLHRLDQFTSNLIVFLRAERSEVKAQEVDFSQIVRECYEELFF